MSITGLHIAAAVGTERAVKENLAQCFGYERLWRFRLKDLSIDEMVGA